MAEFPMFVPGARVRRRIDGLLGTVVRVDDTGVIVRMDHTGELTLGVPAAWELLTETRPKQHEGWD